MADLGLYVLASLLGAGYLLNHQKTRDKPLAQGLTHNDEVVGQNSYESTDYLRTRGVEASRAERNWQLARHPLQNCIIPRYFNTLAVKEDYETVPNRQYNPALVYQVINKLEPAKRAMILARAGLGAGPTGGEQAQYPVTGSGGADQAPGLGINVNNRIPPTGPAWGLVNAHPVPTNGEGVDPLAQIGGSLLPGGQEDFTHNNMVPFYRGTITQDMASDSRTKAGLLELYTGQFKLNRPQKREVGAFFKPQQGFTNVYGWKESRDLTRYNPNNTGKKNNELPFEQIYVGPGLNKGFTNLPSGGFHETLRILPKDVTQLRVDPVLETENRVKAGAAPVARRGILGQQFRNKQELLVTNLYGERNFTAVGEIKGRTLRPNIVMKDTHRKRSRILIGPSKSAYSNKPTAIAKSQVSRRKNYFNTAFRNSARAQLKHGDYGRGGFFTYANNRMTTGVQPQLIAPQRAGGAPNVMRRYYDKAKKTRKQHYVINSRPYGNHGKTQPNKGIAYDPTAWIAKTTVRETTEDSKYTGIVGTVQKKQIANYLDQARTTTKETTEDGTRIGNTGGQAVKRGGGYATTNWYARNTTRQFTGDYEYTGPSNSNTKKTMSYDNNYQMRQNVNKERVSKGRRPTEVGVKLGPQPVRLGIKRLDADRQSQYTAGKDTTAQNYFNPERETACTTTSIKNNLPEFDTRLDPDLLRPFRANPLTQSLASYS